MACVLRHDWHRTVRGVQSSAGGSEQDDKDVAHAVRNAAVEAQAKAKKRAEDQERFKKANVHGVVGSHLQCEKQV
jgi:hypothetical protein